jgi:hypothetical protein
VYDAAAAPSLQDVREGGREEGRETAAIDNEERGQGQSWTGMGKAGLLRATSWLGRSIGKFSKVPFIVTFYSKCNRALTFENVFQGSKSLNAVVSPSAADNQPSQPSQPSKEARSSEWDIRSMPALSWRLKASVTQGRFSTSAASAEEVAENRHTTPKRPLYSGFTE